MRVEQKDFFFYARGAVFMSVCVPRSSPPDEVEAAANHFYPTGVDPWRVKDGAFKTGEPNPCRCKDFPEDRLHYVLSC
jgi:hypothetical protein